MITIASCTSEDLGSIENGQEVTATFAIKSPVQGALTKAAHADPELKDMRVFMAVMHDNKVIHKDSLLGSDFGNGSTPVSFDVRLVTGQPYQVAVWADFGKEYYTIDPEVAKIIMPTNIENNTILPITGSDNKRDAYFSINDVTLKASEAIDITLKRPFGLVKVNTTDNNEPAVVNAGLRASKYSTKFYAPTVLDLVEGDLESEKDITIELSNVSDPVGDGNPKELSFDYIFANSEASPLANFTMAYQNASGADICSYEFSNIPVRRNYKTNITGNILTKKGTINVTVDPNWDGELPHEEGDVTIGSVSYPTLAAAVEAASAGETITLGFGGYTAPEALITKNLTIEQRSGGTTKGSEVKAETFITGELSVASGSTLTLKNVTLLSDPAKMGEQKHGVKLDGAGLVADNVKFNVTPNTANNNTALYTTTAANNKVTLTNCEFNTKGARTVQLNGAEATITGCTFNKPYSYAVQVDAAGGNLTFTNNTINDASYVIYVHGGASGSTITQSDNTAKNVLYPYCARPLAKNGSNTGLDDFWYLVSSDETGDNGLDGVANQAGSTTAMYGTFDKAITLSADYAGQTFYGNNYDINPNTATKRRGATVLTQPLTIQCSDITIAGFDFKGAGIVKNTSAGETQNITFKNNSASGITNNFFYFNGNHSDNLVIENNRVIGVGNDGTTNFSAFNLWQVTDITFKGNYIENVDYHAIAIDESGIAENENTFIENNTVKNIRNSAIQIANKNTGVYSIKNNTIDNAGQEAGGHSAIKIYSWIGNGNKFAGQITIDGNTITNSAYYVSIWNGTYDSVTATATPKPFETGAYVKINNNTFDFTPGTLSNGKARRLFSSSWGYDDVVDFTNNKFTTWTADWAAALANGSINLTNGGKLKVTDSITLEK